MSEDPRYPTEEDRAVLASVRTARDCLCHAQGGAHTRPGMGLSGSCANGHGFCPFLSYGPDGKNRWRRRLARQVKRFRAAGLYWKPLVGWKVAPEHQAKEER